MLSYCTNKRKEKLRKLWKEAHELILIFGKAVSIIDGQNKKSLRF